MVPPLSDRLVDLISSARGTRPTIARGAPVWESATESESDEDDPRTLRECIAAGPHRRMLDVVWPSEPFEGRG